MRNPEHVRRPKTRVVVTGMGVVSPIGIGTENFWRAALSGRVGTSTITQFDTSEFLTSKGGEVKDFEPGRFIKKLPCEELARSTQFAVAVTGMALEDAGLLNSVERRERIGVSFGVVIGNRPAAESPLRTLHGRRGQEGDEFRSTTSHDPSVISRMPAREFGLAGPNVVIPTACAAGNGAIGYAMDMIRAGRADAMIAGGADEMSQTMFMMFNSFRALAPDVVQPFDKNRRGLMLSEGAAAVLLESYEHAKNRGATIYGEVLGHGNFTDAHHMTAPHPEGLGAIRSMQSALRMSGVAPEQIDYINAHGTGTPINDMVETKAIRAVFGRDVDSIPVSSIKSMLGHTQGAASAIESVTCLLAIRDQVIPPTMNYADSDPDCALNIVANEARQQPVNVALNNAFGFGGNISCTIFSGLRGM